jgi:hypothetical protein
MSAPSFVLIPVPMARTSPSLALETVDSGKMIPPAVYDKDVRFTVNTVS